MAEVIPPLNVTTIHVPPLVSETAVDQVVGSPTTGLRETTGVIRLPEVPSGVGTTLPP